MIIKEKNKLPRCECDKCSHKWRPRKEALEEIKKCPKCKTKKWGNKIKDGN